jgi:16S rRNA (uracil1498-N3)-methyltransferase
MLAHCYPGEKQVIPPDLSPENALMLIGPEGDFTPEELTQALKQGYKMITLGENRLRTETAALYATVLMKTYLG